MYLYIGAVVPLLAQALPSRRSAAREYTRESFAIRVYCWCIEEKGQRKLRFWLFEDFVKFLLDEMQGYCTRNASSERRENDLVSIYRVWRVYIREQEIYYAGGKIRRRETVWHILYTRRGQGQWHVRSWGTAVAGESVPPLYAVIALKNWLDRAAYKARRLLLLVLSAQLSSPGYVVQGVDTLDFLSCRCSLSLYGSFFACAYIL